MERLLRTADWNADAVYITRFEQVNDRPPRTMHEVVDDHASGRALSEATPCSRKITQGA
jgi:hypothetical protein